MPDLRIEASDGVEVWTIDRPDSRNALNGDLLIELLIAARSARDNPAVRAVVTAAEGRFWCPGRDLTTIEHKPGMTPDEALLQFCPDLPEHVPGPDLARLGIGAWVNQFSIDKPMIAAIGGGAAGGGLGLAMLHDVRFVSERAKFATAFLAIGIGPEFGLSATLPRAMGAERAMEFLLSGRAVSGAEAVEVGLAQELVSHDRLLDRAVEFATRVAQSSPVAAAAVIRQVRASTSRDMQEQLAHEWADQRHIFAQGQPT